MLDIGTASLVSYHVSYHAYPFATLLNFAMRRWRFDALQPVGIRPNRALLALNRVVLLAVGSFPLLPARKPCLIRPNRPTMGLNGVVLLAVAPAGGARFAALRQRGARPQLDHRPSILGAGRLISIGGAVSLPGGLIRRYRGNGNLLRSRCLGAIPCVAVVLHCFSEGLTGSSSRASVSLVNYISCAHKLGK